MMTLRRLLVVHDEAIIDAGLAWMRQAAALDLAERLFVETRAPVAASVRTYPALLLAADRSGASLEQTITPRSSPRLRIPTLLLAVDRRRASIEPITIQRSLRLRISTLPSGGAGSSPARAAATAARSGSPSSSTPSPNCWAAPFTSTPRPRAALAPTSASPPRPAHDPS